MKYTMIPVKKETRQKLKELSARNNLTYDKFILFLLNMYEKIMYLKR